MGHSITYKDSGVDIDAADNLVESIKAKVQSTYGSRVTQGIGGFACLYDMEDDRYLAAGTDGVGTKVKYAQKLNKHNTIGIDLVAMCVNDVLCTGAKPLFFMDYLAVGKLDVGVAEQILDGVIEGCKQSGCALIGGETAEMPGVYPDGSYDLAGFSVGEVYKDELLDGSKVNSGDTIFALASSGLHSNGFSLVRQLVKEDELELMEQCLTPTKIYWNIINKINKLDKDIIKGMAHITGGGLTNIARINKDMDYNINYLPDVDQMPAVFYEIAKRSGLSHLELYKTFNMGIGMVIITDKPNELSEFLKSENEIHGVIGQVSQGTGKVSVNYEDVSFSYD